MSSMGNALPQPSYRAEQYLQGQQRFNHPVGPSPAIPNQLPVQQPFGNHQYYLQQHPHMAQYYSAPLSPSQTYANMSRPTMGFYHNPVMMNQPGQGPPSTPYYYAQAGHYPAQAQALTGQVFAAQYPPSGTPQSDPRLSKSLHFNQTGTSTPSQDRASSSDSRPSVVRGPPRKPKQSGHAIWVGNLPPQTDLMSLVHHVCKETKGLESLFLISKSNCAFANFKDEQSCAAAQQKLHDSRFQTVRLVSRLRKNTVEGAAGTSAPTGPAASTSQPGSQPDAASPGGGSESERATPMLGPVSEGKTAPSVDGPGSQKDRFFVLKSLTVEDLELSVRTGIWATQSHNEENLNKAFESVDNVYLIFSANKSGEYFGYARMVSPIDNDPTAAIEFAPKAQSASDPDLPKAIPTEATEFAPKGRIIDDSARGTIFWEAERDDSGLESVGGQCDGEESGSGAGSVMEDESGAPGGADGAEGENKAWGKPFKLEWLSTTRLPFYRTRGLRNPWNSNREVKIARDGTELEPSVGRRLIGLFNKSQSPAPGVLSGVSGGLRGTVTMMTGYPPMRPHYQM